MAPANVSVECAVMKVEMGANVSETFCLLIATKGEGGVRATLKKKKVTVTKKNPTAAVLVVL